MPPAALIPAPAQSPGDVVDLYIEQIVLPMVMAAIRASAEAGADAGHYDHIDAGERAQWQEAVAYAMTGHAVHTLLWAIADEYQLDLMVCN